MGDLGWVGTRREELGEAGTGIGWRWERPEGGKAGMCYGGKGRGRVGEGVW